MLGEGILIGKAFGIALRLHYSWFIIFVLVTWGLAGSYFPATYPTWSTAEMIAAGILTSLLFFGSVLLHELMHSIVAQRQGIRVRSIVLFIFGGVSQMTEEPKQPKHEFAMAMAGPMTSLVLGGIFWGIRLQLPNILFVAAIAQWLGTINLFLGLFNLVPGFPLDGGRVLRSILWWRTRNLRRATRTASYVGRAVAYIFIFGGILLVFQGNWFNGLWIAFIGWFLQNAATDSYRQLILQDTLRGHTVSEIMSRECLLVPPGLTVERLANEYILTSGRRCFPVVEGGRVLGLVTIHNVKAIPRHLWSTKTVGEVMTTLDHLKSVGPDADLSTVLRLLTEEDINQVPVVQDRNIVGMIGRDHILAFVNVRGELSR